VTREPRRGARGAGTVECVKTSWIRLVAVTALAVAAVSVVPAGARAASMKRESVAALRKQIDAGQVRAATVYSRKHIIHASLADRRRYTVHDKAAAQRQLVTAMRSHHVRFHIVAGAKQKAKQHGLRLRYIAVLVVGGLAVLGGLGYAVLRRRRRDRPPGAEPAASTE
jgi:sensor c-di-GMP phosphodiesterase-like protein